jgi:hypothetical protein
MHVCCCARISADLHTDWFAWRIVTLRFISLIFCKFEPTRWNKFVNTRNKFTADLVVGGSLHGSGWGGPLQGN